MHQNDYFNNKAYKTRANYFFINKLLFFCFIFNSRDSMEGIMAEHHQQYMRNPLRLFPEGPEMDAASAAAAAMLTEKARSALGLPPSAFWPGSNNPQQQQQQRRNPSSPGDSFQQFMNPAAAAAAMSHLYGHRNPGLPGAVPPPSPHFWSQFYGLNHQLGLLSAAGLVPGFPGTPSHDVLTAAGSPPSPASSQRYSPYPLPQAGNKLHRTPSPRNSSPK